MRPVIRDWGKTTWALSQWLAWPGSHTQRCMPHVVLISSSLCLFICSTLLHACMTTWHLKSFFKQHSVGPCKCCEVLIKKARYDTVKLAFRVACSESPAFYCMTNPHDALLLTFHPPLHQARCSGEQHLFIHYWRWRLLRCCRALLCSGPNKDNPVTIAASCGFQWRGSDISFIHPLFFESAEYPHGNGDLNDRQGLFLFSSPTSHYKAIDLMHMAILII